MKLYRVVSNRWGIMSEAGSLKAGKFYGPPSKGGYNGYITTFTEEEIGFCATKYYFADLIDAVKYYYYFCHFHFTDEIVIIDVPDEIIQPSMIGYGDYTEYVPYYALEILIPYKILYNLFVGGEEYDFEKTENFLMKDGIKLEFLDSDSDICKQIGEYLKENGAVCTYQQELDKFMDTFGPIGRFGAYANEKKRLELFKQFLEMKSKFVGVDTYQKVLTKKNV